MSRRPPVRPPLSDVEQRVLDAIRACIDDTGISPTLREIGTRAGLSVRTVHDRVRALEAAGHIRRPASAVRAIPRTLQLCDGSRPALIALPRLDQVTAVLLLDVADQPPSVFAPDAGGVLACPNGHRRPSFNRWSPAVGIELCRACGRADVAGWLAAKAAGKAVR